MSGCRSVPGYYGAKIISADSLHLSLLSVRKYMYPKSEKTDPFRDPLTWFRAFLMGAFAVLVLCSQAGSALAEEVVPSPESSSDDTPAAAAVSTAPVSPAATFPQTPTLSVAAEVVPAWTKKVTLGGGFILWYYQPLELAGAKNNLSLFFANLVVDAKSGIWGLHVEPRFRDTKLRGFFGGTSWAQEVYASVSLNRETTLKVGKEYSHFGLFWDNSFYGNVQVYDGLKLDPDYGLSLEGGYATAEQAGLRYWAQFFLVDGQTNVALQDRETFSISGARRRNQAIVRLEPFAKTGGVELKLGLSGAYLQADLPTVGKKDVERGAVDISANVAAFSGWAEYLYQHGQSVTDFPATGTFSSHNHYGLAGVQYSVGKVTARYNVSFGRYADVSTTEWMHVPAIAVALGDSLTVLGEYVFWKRYASPIDTLLDRSLNITLAGHF
jgi:hypothetical protein